MNVRPVVECIAVFATGLLAGILSLGDRAETRTRAGNCRRPRSWRFSGSRTAGSPIMPVPILAAVVAGSAWLVLMRSRTGSAEFMLLAAGLACLVVWVAITRIVNIPINGRIDAGDGASLWPRWEHAHTVRTVFAVLAFLCEVAALAVSRSATP